jgi:hypothetical protein
LAPTIPTTEPSRFAAGETVSWTKAVADFPNTDGYSLVYAFGGPTAFSNVTATSESDGSYSVTIAAATTVALTPGVYRWQSYAESGLERYAVESGQFVVTASLLGGNPVVSQAVKTLAVIDAALENRLTSDIESYTILGRSVNKIPISDLIKLRATFAAQVWKENNPGKAGPSRKVTFVPA